MKTTALLFEIEDPLARRPWQRVAPVVVEATEDDVTGVAGIALWGELLDRLGLVGEADRRNLRPIAPGGYSGGECYRPLVEVQLAGGDFLSDVSLLEDEATMRLRGTRRSTGSWPGPTSAGCRRPRRSTGRCCAERGPWERHRRRGS